MAHFLRDLSPRTLARLAGVGILAMVPLAGFSVTATQGLVVTTDPARTVANLEARQLLFRAGICGWVAIAALDVVVALALFGVFRPANVSLSRLAAWFRVVYAAVFLSALGGFLLALRIMGAGAASAGRDALVAASAGQFADVWAVALVIFAIHLGLLGYLAWISGYVPKLLAALLFLASAAYLVGNVGKLLMPAFGATLDPVIAVPAALGELALAVWLLVRADRIPD